MKQKLKQFDISRLKMHQEELRRYMDETKKSAHVFKNKKKYDKKKERQRKWN